jgi:hypothetical protein
LNFLPRSAGHLKTEIYALDDIQEIYSEITWNLYFSASLDTIWVNFKSIAIFFNFQPYVTIRILIREKQSEPMIGNFAIGTLII